MCDCIEQINTYFEPENAALDIPLVISLTTGATRSPRIAVPVVRLDPKKRGPLPAAIAVFCPFCGARYPEE